MLLFVLSKYLNLIRAFGGNKCRHHTAEQMNSEKYLRRFKRTKENDQNLISQRKAQVDRKISKIK